MFAKKHLSWAPYKADLQTGVDGIYLYSSSSAGMLFFMCKWKVNGKSCATWINTMETWLWKQISTKNWWTQIRYYLGD